MLPTGSSKSRALDEAPPPAPTSGGILRRKGSATRRDLADFFAEKANRDAPNPSAGGAIGQRKRSILKYDSFDSTADAGASQAAAVGSSGSVAGGGSGRLRGVLKKDSSYDEGLRPILKHSDETGKAETTAAAASSSVSPVIPVPPPPESASSASSSSEDISKTNRAFSDVVIDPIPGSGRRSSEAVDLPASVGAAAPTPSPCTSSHHSRKASLKERQPMIPPSSVKISSDDRDLAEKLQQLASEADAIRLRQEEEERRKREAAESEALGRRSSEAASAGQTGDSQQKTR